MVTPPGCSAHPVGGSRPWRLPALRTRVSARAPPRLAVGSRAGGEPIQSREDSLPSPPLPSRALLGGAGSGEKTGFLASVVSPWPQGAVGVCLAYRCSALYSMSGGDGTWVLPSPEHHMREHPDHCPGLCRLRAQEVGFSVAYLQKLLLQDSALSGVPLPSPLPLILILPGRRVSLWRK